MRRAVGRAQAGRVEQVLDGERDAVPDPLRPGQEDAHASTLPAAGGPPPGRAVTVRGSGRPDGRSPRGGRRGTDEGLRAGRRAADVLRDPRRGPPAAPAARRLHDGRRDGAVRCRAGRAPAGGRDRAAGARAHGRHRPPDHLRADGGRHGRAGSPPRARAGRRRRLQHGRRHRACSSRSATRSSCAGSSSPRPPTPATACTRPRSRCSPRSRPSCSPARRWRTAYLRLAPNPGDFPQLVEKLKTLDRRRSPGRRRTSAASPRRPWSSWATPTCVRLEHAVELFGLLGGGVMGDLTGLPQSQLAVLPGTTHYMPPGPASWTASTGCSRWSCRSSTRRRRPRRDRVRHARPGGTGAARPAPRARGPARRDGLAARAVLRPGLRLRAHAGHGVHGRRPDVRTTRARPRRSWRSSGGPGRATPG